MKKGIIIFQRILPHYRTGFFKKFCEIFRGTKILYGQPHKNESLQNDIFRNESSFEEIKNFYFNKSGQIFVSGIYLKILKYRPGVIISVFNVGNLNIYFLFFLKFFMRFKLILWSFGYEPSRGFNPKKFFTDKIRLYLSQKADAVIFYWQTGLNEVKYFSKKSEHYFVANNTLDTEVQFRLKESFDRLGKENIMNELGVKERFHFIYVGRLLKDKQIDMLLNAYQSLETKISDCRLTVIGSGPEENELKNLSKELGLKNVDFKGEIIDEEITGKWIYISDVFVMPGRLGLSVVHSFCFGTPVISQDKGKYFHGEGIGYIKNGVNGLLSERENVKSLSDAMFRIISNPGFSEMLKQNAFETARTVCSVEKMLSGFEKAIEYVNKK